MPFVRLTVFLLSMLALSACSTTSEQGFQPGLYTVQHRDTLYSIAWRFDVSYQEIAQWNRLSAPYDIYPGQKLRLSPNAPMPRNTQASAGTNSSKPATPVVKSTPSPRPTTSSKPKTSVPTSVTQVSSWQWPAAGAVLNGFAASSEGKKGINIDGELGDPVLAAADGKVVYSGSGLVGYGELIIINHNKSFLSAYAHNQKRHVREGDVVKKGQKIADLGNSGADRPMLHFEIRMNGKPVDPQDFLPKR